MKRSRSKGCCAAVKGDGSPCGAAPMPGRECCAFHDPARAEAIAAGRRAGGRRRSEPRVTLTAEASDISVHNAQDVCSLLSDTINAVRKGRLDPKIANTVGYLASVMIRALEVGNLEERLAVLEAATSSSHRPESTMFKSHANQEGA